MARAVAVPNDTARHSSEFCSVLAAAFVWVVVGCPVRKGKSAPMYACVGCCGPSSLNEDFVTPAFKVLCPVAALLPAAAAAPLVAAGCCPG